MHRLPGYGGLRQLELDAITESAELSDHARRPVSLGAVIERRTVFFIASTVVQDLPD
jgi:hypothetical protein